MNFARQAGIAVLLVTLTLWIQCAGIAVLIHMARANIERGVARLSSLYFSASSYSTVGYGDVVLPRVWHLLGPVESITGVLMCGISVSCLFAVATRLVERESGAPPMQYVNGSDARSEAELL